jgi:hypothetical protein
LIKIRATSEAASLPSPDVCLGERRRIDRREAGPEQGAAEALEAVERAVLLRLVRAGGRVVDLVAADVAGSERPERQRERRDAAERARARPRRGRPLRGALDRVVGDADHLSSPCRRVLSG